MATITLAIGGLGVAGDRPEQASPSNAEVRPPVRIGYVPYWDQERAFQVARLHTDLFDQISPMWYSLDGNGHVILADNEHTQPDSQAVRYLQSQGVDVVPTVTDLRNGEWRPELVQEMLHDGDTMRTHVDELVRLVVAHGYEGIDIDYEHLRAADREPFTRFLQELGTALHAEGKILAADVHPKTDEAGYDERNEAQDFRAIGTIVDQFRVMAYDHSWDTSPPGPVAPVAWVREVVEWTVSQVPADKVILGIDLLGYDWADDHGVTVDYTQARARARAHDAAVRRSADGTPWFVYHGDDGRRHEVWYEDAVSARAKLDLVTEYGLGGSFFWRLGGEDPAVWRTLPGDIEN